MVEENQTEIEEVKNQNNLELRDIKAKSLKDKGKTSLAKRKSTMLSAEMDKLRDELNTKEE